MYQIRSTLYRCLTALLVLVALPTLAATVYKTVDANGAVSFTDEKPASNASVETLEFDGGVEQSGTLGQQRLEDMRETTDRMVADRMAREKHRAELQKLQAESESLAQEQRAPSEDLVERYITGYGYPAIRPWYHQPRHRPGHSIGEPPYREPDSQRSYRGAAPVVKTTASMMPHR